MKTDRKKIREIYDTLDSLFSDEKFKEAEEYIIKEMETANLVELLCLLTAANWTPKGTLDCFNDLYYKAMDATIAKYGNNKDDIRGTMVGLDKNLIFEPVIKEIIK